MSLVVLGLFSNIGLGVSGSAIIVIGYILFNLCSGSIFINNVV